MVDEYDEVFDEDEARKITHASYMEHLRVQRRRKRQAKAADFNNEVGAIPDPTPEMLERIEFYKNNYVQMHSDIFPRSTGIKPYGPVQIESITRSKEIIDFGGKIVIAEPRGFAKTSRTANHALMAVLQGKIKYALILASSITKAGEILESIKTELMDNQNLQDLYPRPCACFQHLDEKPVRAKLQTYCGDPTYIRWSPDRIRFPVLPGEPSSGSIIQVRSKDNVRGLFTKIRYGPESGSILRPDFFFLDDIQTDEEARNLNSVNKIVNDIKKSVLFAGSHSKRISGIMCCTPICPGDVSTHFILHEPSWEVVCYKMIPKMPTNMDMWLVDYAQILLGYDRHEAGSRRRAQLRARDFVLENYEKLHEGAVVSWEWAYGWNEDPQVEVSALHHAMNFLIEEGTEAFESECQCNIVLTSDKSEELKVTVKEMVDKETNVTEMKVPLDTKFIVTHVDINSEIFTHLTAASPEVITPHIADYGTFPPQDGAVWSKGNILRKISKLYPDIPKEEHGLLIYQATKDYLQSLYGNVYQRTDGVPMQNTIILVDCNYQTEEILKAIRDLPFSSSVVPVRGRGIVAKDRPMDEKSYGAGCIKHHHCVEIPTRSKAELVLTVDTNYFKTRVHQGWKTRIGFPGSITIFPPEWNGHHAVLHSHMISEDPIRDYYEKENREVYIWHQQKGQDNEFFDNLVGVLAGLCKLGAKFRQQTGGGKRKPMNMQEYMNRQKQKKDAG